MKTTTTGSKTKRFYFDGRMAVPVNQYGIRDIPNSKLTFIDRATGEQIPNDKIKDLFNNWRTVEIRVQFGDIQLYNVDINLYNGRYRLTSATGNAELTPEDLKPVGRVKFSEDSEGVVEINQNPKFKTGEQKLTYWATLNKSSRIQ